MSDRKSSNRAARKATTAPRATSKGSRKIRVEAEAMVVPSERPGKTGGKRDENRRERAASIASAALALMLERGVEAVTIDEIVARAKVAKGSFYRYFQDKEQLVGAIVAPVEKPLREAFERCQKALAEAEPGPSLAIPYFSLALEIASMSVEHSAVTRLYLQERRGPAKGPRKPIALIAKLIDESAEQLAMFAAKRGLTRPVHAKISGAFVVGAVEHLAARALSGDQALHAPEVSSELIAIVLDGVRAHPGN